MKLPLPRVACPHLTSAATTSRPKPCPCALSLSQRPSSGETESASSNEAMPRHSLLSRRRMTKENLFGSGVCTLFSPCAKVSLHGGRSHWIKLVIAGLNHSKTFLCIKNLDRPDLQPRDRDKNHKVRQPRRIIRQRTKGGLTKG